MTQDELARLRVALESPDDATPDELILAVMKLRKASELMARAIRCVSIEAATSLRDAEDALR